MRTETQFTVRYAETDQMGIVHHSNYPVWFEAGRTDFFKKIGISYSSIETKGVILPLYEINCKFISPAKYEDEVLVISGIKDITRVRLSFSYQVLNVCSKKLIATGETMHAWTDKDLKPVNAEKNIPDIFAFLNKINSF